MDVARIKLGDRYVSVAEAALVADELLEALRHLVRSVDDLIAESEGVYGLHLNGDPASWDSLTEGGRFEAWLIELERARAAIAKATLGNDPSIEGEVGVMLTAPTTYRDLAIHIDDLYQPPRFLALVLGKTLGAFTWPDLKKLIDAELDGDELC